MSIFDVLTLIGGLCLFLYGMTVMGDALEQRAGSGLRNVLGKLTGNKAAGLATGMGVTAVIQSSSATTVMVVGFVNSGLMSLKQAIHVIMGANIGTTVTAWILSLAGIESSNVFIKLLKPTSFTPILALIGIVMLMFAKKSKTKDTGHILLGFATLMFGMDIMSDAVAGLADIPAFQELFIAFQNPILGVLAGAVLTAIIQSSSASVGILQALALTGRVSYGAAIPIIMGQNIGTCITAILSSFGANKNAKRAALVHLSFNVIGTAVWLSVYSILRALFRPVILTQAADPFGIAVMHSVFNILCTLLLLPMSGLLEKLSMILIPDAKKPEKVDPLDERLLATPFVALERSHAVTVQMAQVAKEAMNEALDQLTEYQPERADRIREKEEEVDRYEDELGSYLVQLSAAGISDADSNEAAKLLKMIGDFERISDHTVNLLESAEEIREKKITLTPAADAELGVLIDAVREAVDMTYHSFAEEDMAVARDVEPLEQVIDRLRETLRNRHILRMQLGECSIDAGFVWSDLLTNLERTADHCSNIAGTVLEMSSMRLDLHDMQRHWRHDNEDFKQKRDEYTRKYALAKE